MENLLRTHDLIERTGRRSPEADRRRDMLAAILQEDGSFPQDWTAKDVAAELTKQCSSNGLKLPVGNALLTWVQIQTVHLRFAYKWINDPAARSPEVPAYLRTLWRKLNEKFPSGATTPLPPARPASPKMWPIGAELTTNGAGHVIVEGEGPPALRVELPQPAAAPPDVEQDPLRFLAEEHAKIFSMLADNYELLFRRIFQRLDKLDAIADSRLKAPPPVYPEALEEVLPESTRRYFEFEMPEKTNYNMVFRYTERFRRSYKKAPAGVHWQIVKALETLATKGMRYPGLGFKRMKIQSATSALARTGCRLYHFRIQRTWRICVNVDSAAKIIWVEVVASHNDKQFYDR